MEQLVVTWASLYCSHSYMLKETEEGAIVALICERQPLLLHQLLDGDLNWADGFPPEGLYRISIVIDFYSANDILRFKLSSPIK